MSWFWCLVLTACLRDGAAAVTARPAAYVPPTGDCSRSTRDLQDVADDRIEVEKTAFSNHYRVVFHAGLGGTGHHVMEKVALACRHTRLCRAAPFRFFLWDPVNMLRGLWSSNNMPLKNVLRKSDSKMRIPSREELHCSVKEGMAAAKASASIENSNYKRGEHEDRMILDMVNGLSLEESRMLSYPNFWTSQDFTQPDIKSLAYMGEEVGVDVRIIVMLRSPWDQVSSAFRRWGVKAKQKGKEGGSIEECIRRFARSQMELVRQLRSLDQRFYTCVDFERLETQAESIDQLVLSQKRPAGKHELKTGKKMFDSAAGFSYKSALDFFIRRGIVGKYGKPTKAQQTLMDALYHPYFIELRRMCDGNTVYRDGLNRTAFAKVGIKH